MLPRTTVLQQLATAVRTATRTSYTPSVVALSSRPFASQARPFVVAAPQVAVSRKATDFGRSLLRPSGCRLSASGSPGEAISEEHVNGLQALRDAQSLQKVADDVYNACQVLFADLEALAARRAVTKERSSDPDAPAGSYALTPDEALFVMQSIDSLSNMLCLVLDPVEWARSNHPDEKFRAACEGVSAWVFNYMNQLNMKTIFYELTKTIRDTPTLLNSLSTEFQFLVKQHVRDLEQGGIHLPASKKETLIEMHDKLNSLNVDPSMLEAELGESRARVELLRTWDETLALRRQYSHMLNQGSFAASSALTSSAGSIENVWEFLTVLSRGIRRQVDQELEMVGATSSTCDVDIRNLIANYLRRNRRDQDAASRRIQQYLGQESVLTGLFGVLEHSFGVQARQVQPAPGELWHPCVRKFHLRDPSNPPESRFLGTLYLDLEARSPKMPGAGHFTLQVGCDVYPMQQRVPWLKRRGSRQRPIILLSATHDSPNRLSLLDVESLFHELGHAMHSFCGQTASQAYSGTRASLDFCEVPSQLFECFVRDHRVLSTFAKDASGNPVPRELVETALLDRSRFASLHMMQQMVMAVWDLSTHDTKEGDTVWRFPSISPTSPPIEVPQADGVVALYRKLYQEYLGLVGTTAGFWDLVSPQHIVSYPAGYYSYLYSLAEVRAMWLERFAANPLDPAAGQALAHEVLRVGGACVPQEVLTKYLGRSEPLGPTKLAGMLANYPFM
eukprot:TRINITY_DN67446_c0_g1_i1.p1 TRINITY_DN67446_c0_g1~~TRINITY_DN67446_c0_g1_i1.p1  ORF type:complete len:733 (+),score=170.27 TRINITY_DN67446_c0_g1_i1:115-2313(+)